MAPPATASVTTVQKNILAAIKTLSDRMDAQGIAATAAMELRFSNQEEMSDLKARGRVDPLAVRLDSIDKSIKAADERTAALDKKIEDRFSVLDKKIEDRILPLDSKIQAQQIGLSVIQAAWEDQIKPTVNKVVDLRIEFAKFVAAGGGFGVVGMLLFGAGKAAGWW